MEPEEPIDLEALLLFLDKEIGKENKEQKKWKRKGQTNFDGFSFTKNEKIESLKQEINIKDEIIISLLHIINKK